MAVIEIKVPDIGDFSEVSVIEVLVKPGDTIKAEQSLITVESDKASIEIPSSQSGVVKEVLVKLGDKVREGSLVLLLESAEAASNLPAAPASAPVVQPVSAAPVPATAPMTTPTVAASMPTPMPATTPALPNEPPLTPGQLPHASPSVRKFAREIGVPLEEVKGSGLRGRITQEDVQHFSRAVMSGDTQTRASSLQGSAASGQANLGLLAWPKVDFAKFGPIERQDLSRIKKISGANLHRNWVMIPHVTNHDNADVTELEALRVKLNSEQSDGPAAKITMLAFVIKACVVALKKFPEFNASLDGEQLVYKQYYHIGFAADTPNGLVVPVLRDADRKGIAQLSQELSELSKKARDGKLAVADMTGGCFSISSLGGIGGRYFSPIINAPEVAILGISKAVMEPVWNGLEFIPRLMLPLSLSYDHRVIDGATAARFNVYLTQLLADFRRVLL